MIALLSRVLSFVHSSSSPGLGTLGRVRSAAAGRPVTVSFGQPELRRVSNVDIDAGAKTNLFSSGNAASMALLCVPCSRVSAFHSSPFHDFRDRGRATLGSEVVEREGRRKVSQDSNSNRVPPVVVEEEAEEEVRKYHPRRLAGEQRWQYAVRKKRLGGPSGHSRGSTRTIEQLEEFVDKVHLGDEPQGDDWRMKKIAWLCKQIPTLRPRPLITILNEQRKWITSADTKYIIQHLLQIRDSPRAHRVFKWEMQQPWSEFDFELSSKVATQLGQSNKLTRTRDIFDLIIRNGKVPDLATYTALINCYILAGEGPALAKACSLHKQMSQLGGHEPPATLTYDLFEGLVKSGATHIDLADEVFETTKAAGLVCSPKMYTKLIHGHGLKGNRERVLSLIDEMKETGLSISQDVHAAVLKACSKDGCVDAGERAFADLKAAGHKPPPAVYSSVIKMYVKAGMPVKAAEVLKEMRETGASLNLTGYELMMEVAVLTGDRAEAESLLLEALEKRIQSLHGCYNAMMELYSENDLLNELETTFHEMEERGYPPNVASYNILLGAYVRNRLQEKAEAIYVDLKDRRQLKPNKDTYEHMLRLYGEAKNSVKLQEILKELTERKMKIPEAGIVSLQEAVRPKQLEAHRNSQLKLIREQREILAGVLLAGAIIQSHDRDRTYEIHFRLALDNENRPPVLHHLFQEFSAWATGPPSEVCVPGLKDSSRQKTLLAFQTVSHGSFRFFAHQYRPSHVPAIPRLVHRWLTPRALAYWYMYGGGRCPVTGDLLFGASLYSDQEIMLVVNALRARTIDSEKTGKKQGKVIRCSGKSAIWIWGLMEPHIIPEVKASLSPDGKAGMECVT